MDPLSVASASASLLGLTVQIMGDFYGRWDNRSTPAAERLVYEVSRLRDTFETVETTSSSINGPLVVHDLPEVLEGTRQTLLMLRAKLLDGMSGDGFDFAEQSWQWETYNPGRSGASLPLSKSEAAESVRDLQLCISRLRTSLSRIPALLPDPRSDLRPGLVQQPSDGIWRLKADYSDAHANAQAKRVDGTGIWMLRHTLFRRWLSNDKSHNVLYCPGRPGSGKTVLASHVIDELKRLCSDDTNLSIGLAYFYFNYKISTTIIGVALALLEQLYLQSSTLAVEVRDLEKRANLTEVQLGDVISVLLAVVGRFRKAYIVIDAIDECANEHHPDLLQLLSSVAASRCRLFSTSRPTQPFELFTMAFTPNIEIRPPKEDIETCVRFKIQNEPKLRNLLSTDLENKVVDAMGDMVLKHGVFLLVDLQLQVLMTLTSPADVLPKLETIEDTLGKVFVDNIKRMMQQSEELRDLAVTTMTWLFHCWRTLRPTELSEILQHHTKSSDPVDIELALQACLGFVSGSRASNTVSFMHYSVYEYLDSCREQGRTPPLGEEVVAECCLTYLLEMSAAHRAATPTDQMDLFMTSHPFYEYAARYWGKHVKRVGSRLGKGVAPSVMGKPGSELQRLTRAFLKDHISVKNAAQIVFKAHRPPGDPDTVLFPTTWMHMTAYFGLAWVFEDEGSDPSNQNLALAKDGLGRTPLHIAAQEGHHDCVDVLVRHLQSDPMITDQSGKTAWHYAAMSGIGKKEADWMLRRTKQPMKIMDCDKANKTPLDYAARGHIGTVKYLLDLEAVPKDVLDSGLSSSLENGNNTDIIDCLLEAGADPKPLHLLMAIKKGFDAAVLHLLEYGVEVNPPTPDEASPLHVATLYGKQSILELLIRSGADIEAKDSTGRTALACAVENGDATSVNILLKAGADPRISLPEQETAVVYAAGRGMTDVVQMLIQAGANPGPAVISAVDKGHSQALGAVLEELGGGQQTSVNAGLWDRAAESGYEDVKKVLQSEGVPGQPRPIYTAEFEADEDPMAEESRDDQKNTCDTSVSASNADDSYYEVEEVHGRRTGIDRSVDASLGETSDTSRQLEPFRQRRAIRRGSIPAIMPVVQRSVQPAVQTTALTQPSVKSGVRDRAAYIILQNPISTSDLMIGTIVEDPRDPLRAFIPRENLHLADVIRDNIHESVQYDYEMFQERETKVSIQALQLGAGSSRRMSLQIQAPKLVRIGLKNHVEVMKKILSIYGPEVLRLVEEKRKGYAVVGLMVLVDSKVKNQALKGAEIHGGGLTVGGVALGPSQQVGDSIEAFHLGPRIFAIQYREIVIRRSALKMLSKKRVADLYLEGYAAGAKSEVVF